MLGMQEAVNLIKTEFDAHIKKGDNSEFKASPEAQAALAAATRLLEQKRQTANLTEQENHLLRSADELYERIAKYNQRTRAQKPVLLRQESLYDLSKGNRILAEQPAAEPSPFVVPRISSREVDQIIENLNEQFEQKVLKQIRNRTEKVSAKPPEAVNDFAALPRPTPEAGRNLHEYLSEIKQELPNLPFVDADSHFDLSKAKI